MYNFPFSVSCLLSLNFIYLFFSSTRVNIDYFKFGLFEFTYCPRIYSKWGNIFVSSVPFVRLHMSIRLCIFGYHAFYIKQPWLLLHFFFYTIDKALLPPSFECETQTQWKSAHCFNSIWCRFALNPWTLNMAYKTFHH